MKPKKAHTLVDSYPRNNYSAELDLDSLADGFIQKESRRTMWETQLCLASRFSSAEALS